jgi:AraC-like DNA-binding protein
VNRKKPNRCEYIRLWRPPGVESIELYSAHLVSHTYGKHFHEAYTIGVNDAGVGSFWCRGANHVATPKSLNLLAPGEVHTGAAAGDEGWTYRNLYLAASVIEGIARQLDWQPGGLLRFRQAIAPDDHVWLAVDRVFRVLNVPQSRLGTDTTLLTSLRLVLERFADRLPPARRVARHVRAVAQAREYLRDRCHEEISLDELAAVAGLSPYYLIRCFRRELGLPPHAYQLQLRLQRAKADLKSGASLAGVALKHGFFDQSHLHRHFKRAFGLTPGQYRAGNRVQDEGQPVE